MSAGISTAIELDIGGFLAPLRNLSAELDKFRGLMSGLTASFTGITAVGGAIQSAFSGLFAGVGESIAAASETENLQASFATLLGGADAAKERLAELLKFSESTHFELPGVARASKVLQTLTHGALATGEGLRMVGDVAANTGEPFEQIAMHIGRLYDGLQNGRPVGESMMRLQELGVISTDTRAQIEALQRSGKKGDDVWSVAAAAFGQFGGEMERQSQTFTGVSSNLNEAWRGVQRAFGEPLAAALIPGIRELTASLGDWQGAAQSVGAKLGGVVTRFTELSIGAASLAGWLAQFTPLFAGLAGQFVLFKAMNAGAFTPLKVGLQAAGYQVSVFMAQLRGGQVSLASFGAAAQSLGTKLRGAINANGIGLAAAGFGYGISKYMERINELKEGVTEFQRLSTEFEKKQMGWIEERGNLDSEEERAALLKEMSGEAKRLLETYREISDRDASTGEAKKTQSEQLELLRQQLAIIGVMKQKVRDVGAEQIRANAAARGAAEGRAAAEKRVTDELQKQAKELENLAEKYDELQGKKKTEAFDALAPKEQKKKLLAEARVPDEGGLDRRIEGFHLRDQPGSRVPLSRGEKIEYQQALQTKERLIPINKNIAAEDEKAADKTKQDEKKAEDEKQTGAKFDRGAQLEIAKYKAVERGDKKEVARIEKIERYDAAKEKAVGAGKDEKEADSYAREIVTAEDKAKAKEEGDKVTPEKSATLSVSADADRKSGLGGAAFGYRQDPTIAAQRAAAKSSDSLKDSIDKLNKTLSEKKEPPRQTVVPVFQ